MDLLVGISQRNTLCSAVENNRRLLSAENAVYPGQFPPRGISAFNSPELVSRTIKKPLCLVSQFPKFVMAPQQPEMATEFPSGLKAVEMTV